MGERIRQDVRRAVAARAGRRCEYCHIHEDDTFFGCEVDHIISLKHGGTSSLDNLAYACFFCNRKKGSDIGSRSPSSGQFLRFFHPRGDSWPEHFRVEGMQIKPLTEIGEVTAQILDFNSEDRTLERQSLIAAGRFPAVSNDR